MLVRTIAGAGACLGLAGPALAASFIVTPPLDPPAGGLVACLVANASPKKPLEVRVTIYDVNGAAANALGPISIAPNRSNQVFAPIGTQGHCVVEVTKGGKKQARVSLQMQDGAGTRLAAVNGE
jgi:hypothetical protein